VNIGFFLVIVSIKLVVSFCKLRMQLEVISSYRYHTLTTLHIYGPWDWRNCSPFVHEETPLMLKGNYIARELFYSLSLNMVLNVSPVYGGW